MKTIEKLKETISKAAGKLDQALKKAIRYKYKREIDALLNEAYRNHPPKKLLELHEYAKKLSTYCINNFADNYFYVRAHKAQKILEQKIKNIKEDKT